MDHGFFLLGQSGQAGGFALSPNLTIISDGKKFMWDGQLFDTRDDSLRAAEAYQKDNFEVRIQEQEGKFLVYSRRLVKEHVLTEA